jgi:hypothetical protein
MEVDIATGNTVAYSNTKIFLGSDDYTAREYRLGNGSQVVKIQITSDRILVCN